MTDPKAATACPKCNAEARCDAGVLGIQYACGSWTRSDGLFEQSADCRIALLESSLAAAQAEAAELRKERDGLRAVVEELEWSSTYQGRDREPIDCCPMCGVAEEIGVHGQDCFLWAALAAKGGTP